MNNGVNVIEALQNRHLFGALPAFKDLTTWKAWLVFTKAVYGLPMDAEEERLFCQHTGRSRYRPPAGGYPEAVAIVGVQSGKSRIASVFAGHAALTGQRGTYAALIGQDLRGAMRVLLRYSREPFEQLDHFKAEVMRTTADTLDLANGVSLSAYPCRPEGVRGIRACIVVIDELAFFTATDGRPTDTEMLRVARGRVATTGGKLIILSSPYGQFGALHDLHRRHYGRDESSTLIWQASAPEMNPTLSPDYLARMAQDDPDAYASEVLGQFRQGLSRLFEPEALEAVVDEGVKEREHVKGRRIRWFLDSASGSGKDRMTLAGSQYDPVRKVSLLNVVRVWYPPFNPSGVLAEVCEEIKRSGETEATGDRYAPGFVAEACRANGIIYRFSERDRSQIYLELLPLVNAGRLRLLDHQDLLRELRSLERRRGSSGKDRIDHPHGLHDDVANSVAGSLLLANAQPIGWTFYSGGRTITSDPEPEAPSLVARAMAAVGEVIDTVTDRLAATSKVLSSAVTPDQPEKPCTPCREGHTRTIQEIEALAPGCRAPFEQKKLDEHYAQLAKKHEPSEFEQSILDDPSRIYWPSDGLPRLPLRDLETEFELTRQRFAEWR